MATDAEIRAAGYEYISPQRYLQNPFVLPTTEEEEVTQGSGIPYTGAFTGRGGDDNAAALGAYTGRTYNPESYITNRGALSGEYIQGTEPEENYMSKIGGMIKSGIGMAIPGGNFLMNMVGKLDNFKNLSPADQEFARQQMSFQEQSVHPGGNLDNQDRYGYNKRSMMGNYANVISKRVAIAKQYQLDNPNKKIRDIDQYYLDKEEEQNALTKQMEFNDFIRQRQAANKFRAMQATGTSPFPSGKDIHGGGEDASTSGSITTAPRKTVSETAGSEDAYTPSRGNVTPESLGMSTTGGGDPFFNKGGRVPFFYGGLATAL